MFPADQANSWHAYCLYPGQEVEVSPPFLPSHLLIGPARKATWQGQLFYASSKTASATQHVKKNAIFKRRSVNALTPHLFSNERFPISRYKNLCSVFRQCFAARQTLLGLRKTPFVLHTEPPHQYIIGTSIAENPTKRENNNRMVMEALCRMAVVGVVGGGI